MEPEFLLLSYVIIFIKVYGKSNREEVSKQCENVTFKRKIKSTRREEIRARGRSGQGAGRDQGKGQGQIRARGRDLSSSFSQPFSQTATEMRCSNRSSWAATSIDSPFI